MRIREAPLLELVAHVVRSLLVRLAARRPGAGHVSDVAERLEHFRSLGRLGANAIDHRPIDRLLRGDSDAGSDEENGRKNAMHTEHDSLEKNRLWNGNRLLCGRLYSGAET